MGDPLIADTRMMTPQQQHQLMSGNHGNQQLMGGNQQLMGGNHGNQQLVLGSPPLVIAADPHFERVMGDGTSQAELGGSPTNQMQRRIVMEGSPTNQMQGRVVMGNCHGIQFVTPTFVDPIQTPPAYLVPTSFVVSAFAV